MSRVGRIPSVVNTPEEENGDLEDVAARDGEAQDEDHDEEDQMAISRVGHTIRLVGNTINRVGYTIRRVGNTEGRVGHSTRHVGHTPGRCRGP